MPFPCSLLAMRRGALSAFRRRAAEFTQGTWIQVRKRPAATHSLHRNFSTPGVIDDDVPPQKFFEPSYQHLPTKAVQSGESGGRVSMQDCLTTPIAQTSAYTFKNTQQLIDFCEQRYDSHEYGRLVVCPSLVCSPAIRAACTMPLIVSHI